MSKVLTLAVAASSIRPLERGKKRGGGGGFKEPPSLLFPPRPKRKKDQTAQLGEKERNRKASGFFGESREEVRMKLRLFTIEQIKRRSGLKGGRSKGALRPLLLLRRLNQRGRDGNRKFYFHDATL